MSSIPEIRRRIKAVEDTRKITRAMYLISSAKMQKALKMHERNLPYFERVQSDMKYIVENTDAELHNKYFRQTCCKRAVYLVIAADKGLCGAYNADVLKLADHQIAQGCHEQVFVFTIGLMASLHFQRRGIDPDVHYVHIAQDPSLTACRQVALELCDMYEQDMFDEAYIIFTNMKSSRVIKPEVLRLLPVLPEDFVEVESFHESTGELEFHPSEGDVLNALVPQHLIGLVYSACVQSYASEQSARMLAMDASTRNADEMLDKLKMERNRARQAAITQELTEITSGASAIG
ncbi:MAG: ATP synthase F1 subunit gamma [Oscillospiraceae bacterium]|jgi:F-type H+-transporting ATPase subunit gamma|nr:ATP synthase F1 subunit gamma [Oscillospiraceae bacterium]